MAGVPIYPSRGRGGGWRLIGGARTDLTGLTEGEVTSLFIALAQTPARGPESTAAMRKLVRAAPAPFRQSAQRVADATVRDPPWGEREDPSVSSLIAQLQEAIARRRQVRMEYDGTAASSVDVVPLVVGSRGSRWYLLGAPAGDSRVADIDRLRTYRVDRIRALRVLDADGAPPASFDPGAAWAAMVERVEELRGESRAVVRVEPWALRALCDSFGAQARLLEGEGTLVEVRAHRIDALAEQLAGWTGVAEVIEPVEVRRQLRRIGERLVRVYDDAAD